MSEENKDGDGIHVRAVRYGYDRPNGFMYKDIETHYRRRGREWEIVKKFLNDAFDNFTLNANRITPYILLEQLGNKNADESKYTLSHQAYIQYFEYEKLQQAKEDTILAQNLSRKAIIIANKTLWVAYFTLVITLVALLYSIYFSTKQTSYPIKFGEDHHHKTFRSVRR